MYHRLPVRVRDDDAGFSLIELMVVIAVLALLIGMGIWLMWGAGSATGARTAQGQIAQDLMLCAKKAEATKKPWGILFYGKTYGSSEAAMAWRNTYRWYYFDGYGDDEHDAATCLIDWEEPPIGASPAGGEPYHVYRVHLQDGAKLFGTYGSTYPSSTSYLYMRFKPVGATIVTQYGRWVSGMRVWYDISDDPGYLQIDVSDRSGEKTENVKIYKLGYVGAQ